MPMLAGHRWHSATLVLELAAIATLLRGNYHIAQRVLTIARAATAPESARAQLLQAGEWHAHRSASWAILSITLALAMVSCWVLTYRDQKPASHPVLWILAVVYVLLVFAIV